jgi:uncharacterized protein (TIGR02118 family)
VGALGVTAPMKLLGLVRGASIADLAALPWAARPLRGFVVSEVIDHLVPGVKADAFVEQWLDDPTGWAPPSGLDAVWWTTTEHVFKRRRPDLATASTVKVIGSAYRRDDFTTRAFFDYWRDVHAAISGRAPGLGAYVVSEVVERVAGDLDADGFVEQWWPDRATLDRASASPEVAVAWEDVQKYAKPSGTFWITREHVVIPPPADAPGTLEG